MSQVSNATILITGGASGIGKIMARICLEKGARQVIVWDRDEEAIQEIRRGFSLHLDRLHTYCVDVTETEKVIRTARENLHTHGPVDILINNAGIVVGKFFESHSHAEIDRTMLVNTQALMHITLEFLPEMIQQNRGHIVNIASAAGMAANPQMSVYVASKWAVIGWGETLRLELESRYPGIHVTTATPFYIGTEMFKGVHSPIVPIVKPETAARKIIEAMERNRIYARMPWLVHTMPFFKGILPQRWFDALIGRWFGIYSSMKNFQGRS
jgi:short-subunit dehydrogenase